MLPAKFGSIWPSSLIGEDFFNISKLGRKHLCKILYKASSYGSIWPTNMATNSNFFFCLATVKNIFSSETPWLNGKNLYRVSNIDASCQVWFHLAKEFQGRRFV
jgi:hypothetical protein